LKAAQSITKRKQIYTSAIASGMQSALMIVVSIERLSIVSGENGAGLEVIGRLESFCLDG